MPFRILAALVGIAGLIAIVSALILAWRGVHPMTFGDIIMLPGIACFTCLMFHAAVYGGRYGITERNDSRLANVGESYMLLLLAYWIFTF